MDQAKQAGRPEQELKAQAVAGRRPVYPHPIIAREGWPFAAASAAAALAASLIWGWAWAAPLWLLALFILQFFRDPARPIPAEAGAVLCPADGRVVAVEPATDPYLGRKCLKVSVFMNVFNVHSNRSPVDGVVKQHWYNPGAFLNAALDKASSQNERSALWLQTEDARDLICVQVAGLIARRILCYAKQGDRLSRGERYGFIRFGSRVDLYLPPDCRIRVTIGDKVQASATIIAELV